MLLEEGRLADAEALLRGILTYVESTQVRSLCVCEMRECRQGALGAEAGGRGRV